MEVEQKKKDTEKSALHWWGFDFLFDSIFNYIKTV